MKASLFGPSNAPFATSTIRVRNATTLKDMFVVHASKLNLSKVEDFLSKHVNNMYYIAHWRDHECNSLEANFTAGFSLKVQMVSSKETLNFERGSRRDF
jgi:hypothetical protein